MPRGKVCALTEVLGRPKLADEPDFATNSDRVANRDRLGDQLETRLREKPAASWVAELSRARARFRGPTTASLA